MGNLLSSISVTISLLIKKPFALSYFMKQTVNLPSLIKKN
jgi:hypothetical protein